ncbi:MAG TPA: Gfo/Idh/MocA family oxidoreductase [Candidatus Methylacidiphilales bacterium]|jgi:predicted dehydrogenase|nr:Gfo/Idh/MocA family oxidoreductase [Candidatus Methylacidiphilales bacterium]
MSTKNNHKKLRVGIVGAGGIVKQRHLPGLQALPNVEVVAVCNSRLDSAQAVAKQFNIPEVFSDWAEMLDHREIDIIWIGTPPVLHAPITISALEAGKHVFCQARMAMNLREGREMLAAAQARPQLVTMLCPPPHGMKGGKFFQKLLRDGYVGEIWHFRLMVCRDTFSDPLAPPHWRQRTELNGINCLTLGIYAEVLQRWLGSPRRLHAQMKVSVPKREGYVVHVPDVVHVIAQWPNGIAANLEWSGVAQFPPDETLTIYGRDGTLVYNFTTDEILGARRGDKELRSLSIPPELQTEWTVERDFIEAVVVGGHPEPSFETGVQYLEFTEAVNQSARGGHAVELPLP